jgi:hypothetical protein
MISGGSASSSGMRAIAALKWSESTWALPAAASRNASTRKYTQGSSVLRDHSKLMVPGSAREAAVKPSISRGNSSAYSGRIGCRTTMKILLDHDVYLVDFAN